MMYDNCKLKLRSLVLRFCLMFLIRVNRQNDVEE